MLWSVLPYIVLVKRVLNIKTLNVHPFHIWEYLTSLGFGAYKGYLTHQQELFLYRNARYLKHHAGKKSLLKILEEVFLYPLMYSLSKKIIVAHTVGREQHHDKQPDIVPSSGSVEEYLSSTTFDSFLKTVFTEGHDVRNDSSYRDSVTDLFSKSPTNRLNTKFLEFDRNIDISEMMLLIRFILDSTVYLHTQNKLNFRVHVTSPVSKNILIFDSVLDALNLLYYCVYTLLEGTPTTPFSFYTLTTAISHIRPPVINKYAFIDGKRYFISNYVALEEFVPQINYVTDEITTSRDLSDSLGEQYIWLFGMINKLKSISDTIENEAHNHVFRTLVPERQVVSIDQVHMSYDTYFQAYPEVYDDLQHVIHDEQYGEFIYAILSGICPLEYGFAKLARDDEVISILIHKIKELFMYMVSYNINFINRTFEQSMYVDIPHLTLHTERSVVGPGWWTPGWWDPGGGSTIPGGGIIRPGDPGWVPSISIGSAYFITDDANNTMDYRIKITIHTEHTLDIVYKNECDIAITTTSVLMDVDVDSVDLPSIIQRGQSTIYYTHVGALVELTTTSVV